MTWEKEEISVKILKRDLFWSIYVMNDTLCHSTVRSNENNWISGGVKYGNERTMFATSLNQIMSGITENGIKKVKVIYSLGMV